jgi:hypothetical protein
MFLYFVEYNYLKIKWNNPVMVAQLVAACPKTDATDATAKSWCNIDGDMPKASRAAGFRPKSSR